MAALLLVGVEEIVFKCWWQVVSIVVAGIVIIDGSFIISWSGGDCI